MLPCHRASSEAKTKEHKLTFKTALFENTLAYCFMPLTGLFSVNSSESIQIICEPSESKTVPTFFVFHVGYCYWQMCDRTKIKIQSHESNRFSNQLILHMLHLSVFNTRNANLIFHVIFLYNCICVPFHIYCIIKRSSGSNYDKNEREFSIAGLSKKNILSPEIAFHHDCSYDKDELIKMRRYVSQTHINLGRVR